MQQRQVRTAAELVRATGEARMARDVLSHHSDAREKTLGFVNHTRGEVVYIELADWKQSCARSDRPEDINPELWDTFTLYMKTPRGRDKLLGPKRD